MSEIRVPKFSVDAGGAALTAEKEYEFDEVWKLTLPNHVGVEPSRRLRTASFDTARYVAEELAKVLAEAETCYREIQQETEKRVNDILVAARDA